MILQKYCASGNDFLIFHTFAKSDRAMLAKELCDRRYGFGADGLIVLLPSFEADFEWEFYNSDGSFAAMCGNGSRAAALYAVDNLSMQASMSFITGAGVIRAHVEGLRSVETELTPSKRVGEFEDGGFRWSLIDTGVPHLATRTEKDFFDIELARDMRQKYNANVNFYRFDGELLRVRTFERGVEGETLACGTGMAACAMDAGGGDGDFEVRPKSDERIEIKIRGSQILFKGDVKRVGTVFA